MKNEAASWPLDIEQLLSPIFRAEESFVVILPGTDEGREAAAVLARNGISRDDLKLYTSEDILGIHQEYLERRSVVAKVVGVMVDDDDGRDLYLGYAGEGRSALWVRVPDRMDAQQVLRVLADRDYLHARYYGDQGVQDFHLS